MKHKGDVKEATEQNDQDPMKKLEDALLICKFGKLNILLLVASLMAVQATCTATSSVSFILPSAECDLDMTMMEKGVLSGIVFIGQICAGLFTGFLTDAFGRRIFLVAGNLALFTSSVIGASSQTYGMLVFAKLMDGAVLSLVFSAAQSMTAEFSHKSVRDIMLVVHSSFATSAMIFIALISWAVLPQQWEFVVIDGYFEIHSWNIYLYISALWSLGAAILYLWIPESPKFLLSHGQEDKALQVLKKIYRINTGKSEDTFPIKSLRGPDSPSYKSSEKASIRKKIANALFDTKELFRPPLLLRLILFSIASIACLLVVGALKLWYPQLSTIIENYDREHNDTSNQFCTIIDSYTASNNNITAAVRNITEAQECVPQLAGTETYINSIILGVVSLLCISVSGFFVKLFGQKPVIFVYLIVCAACSGSLFWTNSSFQVAMLISITCGFMQTAFCLQQNVLVRVFPTTVRTIAISIVWLTGRAGSLLGSVLFPWLMAKGCMIPFILISVISISIAGIVYFLPNPRNENSGAGDK